MPVTAYSYLREDFMGVIELHSDSVWPTADWSMYLYFEAMWTQYNLYGLQRTGTGVLSDGGKTLTVFIPSPPKVLKLTVGVYSKVFSFLDGGEDFGRELVFTSSCGVNEGSVKTTGVQAFILFNGRPEDTLNGNAYRAWITDAAGKVAAYALGQRFTSVSDGSAVFGFGGIFFARVVWLEASPPGDYWFVFKEGSLVKRSVHWNGSTFSGLTSQRFNVKPGDVFTLERFSTSFFVGGGS